LKYSELYQALGTNLSAQDTVVIIPDYRIYPTGTMEDMMEDITDCLHWINLNLEYAVPVFYFSHPTPAAAQGSIGGVPISLHTRSPWHSNRKRFIQNDSWRPG
jgi:hypothetical protein